MDLKFFCPRWGSELLPWDAFFIKAKSAGFDGVEIGFPYDLPKIEQHEILDGLAANNLQAIGQHWQTIEPNFKKHTEEFAKHLYSLAALKPLFINSQTGKDYFSIQQNLSLFDLADQISAKTGVKIIHETHRGKWSFATHITYEYLKLNSTLRLTLDISHWFNVAESFLEDQAEAVEAAVRRADHLHARIGFQEGPQVIDPRIAPNAEIVAYHLKWWDRLVDIKRAQNQTYFTITPEYGAPPYQQLFPSNGQPIANQWEINVWMKDLLSNRYSGSKTSR